MGREAGRERVLAIALAWLLGGCVSEPVKRAGESVRHSAAAAVDAAPTPDQSGAAAPSVGGGFVAPAAAVVLAHSTRQLASGVTDARKFKGGVISPRILIDNPYLEPGDPFFNIPRRVACLPGGDLAVFSTAKRHGAGRLAGTPVASGLWRVAPDGAITALDGAYPAADEGRGPECGTRPGASRLDPGRVGPISVSPDGTLSFPYQSAWAFGRSARILQLPPTGALAPVPEAPRACDAEPPPTVRELFRDIASAARDPAGNTWALDAGRCQLTRVAPDGRVTVVLDAAQVCPADQPERHVRGAAMLWDAARAELVMGGSLLWTRAPKADLYSTIWRVRPDGSLKRIYLAGKQGRGLPHIDGLSGLALDGRGRVLFGAGIMGSGGGFQILRLDEASGRTEVVAGAPRPSDVNHADGPARQAHFGTIRDLCAAPDGTLYVNDANHLIRKLSPAGQVSTWAF